MNPGTYLIDLQNPETLRLMNQTGLQQCIVPNPTPHTSCWDSILAPDGRLYMSLCSEITTEEYAKLAIYDPQTNTIRELAYMRENQFAADRTIRPSKFHTSFSWMNDGRLIMLTHTTDKAPQHPTWMPQAYYANPWEGFQGSAMLIYDTQTGHLENLGVPVPWETLYGGVYDKISGNYFAIGYLKGELYRINPATREVKNYGQVTECASYRLIVGSDDNIYFTTRNGVVQRINVREDRVENLGFQLPHVKEPGRLPPYFSFALNGPDGRLYMAGMHDRRLSVFDPKTGEFAVLGNYMEEEAYVRGEESNIYMGCMAFDKKGILYYVIVGNRKGQRDSYYRLPCVLMRWDLFGGGKPEKLGIVGTPERVIVQTFSMIIDQARDMMYIFDANHADDGPDVTAVDLAQWRGHEKEPGPEPLDVLIRPGNLAYEAHAESNRRSNRAMADNPTSFMADTVIPVPLWQTFADAEQADSGVVSLEFAGDQLEVVTGVNRFYRFTLSLDGEILTKTGTVPPADCDAVSAGSADMPWYPGRQYKAGITHSALLSDGRYLAATADGLLAVIDGEKTFALGPAWVNGPVRAMTAAPDGHTVWGVAGDEEDMCVVFSYSDDRGLRWLGNAYANSTSRGVHSSPQLTAIAVSPDGTMLAIGAGGRMGHVYLYRLEKQ